MKKRFQRLLFTRVNLMKSIFCRLWERSHSGN